MKRELDICFIALHSMSKLREYFRTDNTVSINFCKSLCSKGRVFFVLAIGMEQM